MKEKAAKQVREKQPREANAKLAELKAATANAQKRQPRAALADQRAVQAAKNYVSRLQNAPCSLQRSRSGSQ